MKELLLFLGFQGAFSWVKLSELTRPLLENDWTELDLIRQSPIYFQMNANKGSVTDTNLSC